MRHTITFYPFLCYFYISCRDLPGIRETSILTQGCQPSHGILRFLNLHLEVMERLPLHSLHPNLETNIFISISFLYLFSTSARNKGNKRFQLKDVRQVMDFKVLNLHLEVME